jgi:hypothetical protein
MLQSQHFCCLNVMRAFVVTTQRLKRVQILDRMIRLFLLLLQVFPYIFGQTVYEYQYVTIYDYPDTSCKTPYASAQSYKLRTCFVDYTTTNQWVRYVNTPDVFDGTNYIPQNSYYKQYFVGNPCTGIVSRVDSYVSYTNCTNGVGVLPSNSFPSFVSTNQGILYS